MYEHGYSSTPPAALRAANDNGPVGRPPALVSALRHFAQTGLSARETALRSVQEAQTTGDAAATSHWLTIGRMFTPASRGRIPVAPVQAEVEVGTTTKRR